MAKTVKNTANPTQDANEPIKGTRNQVVTPQIVVRQVDRSPKDVSTLQSGLLAAESVYFPNPSRLFDLFADLERDAFLRGIMNKRVSQVVNKKLMFTKGGEEDPDMMKLIKTKVFKDVMREIVRTKNWGRNGLEFIPGEKLAFNLIPKKHIEPHTQMIVFEQNMRTTGVSYVDLQNIWILGEPHDLGLLLVAGFLTLLKKGVISDWAQYIQIFGIPPMLIKYKGYDMQAQKAAQKIIDTVGSSMRVVVPEEMNLELVESKGTSGQGSQNDFRKAANEELLILFLGNTETTGHSGTGTGAKSEVHASQQLEIIKDDMDDIVDLLNSDHFMNILRSYGYPVDGGQFEFDHEVDLAQLKVLAPIHISLLEVGVGIPKSFFYETYGIPEPKPGEEVIQLSPITPAVPTAEEVEKTGQVSEHPANAGEKPKPKKPAPKTAANPPSANLNDNKPASIADVKALLTDFFADALK